MIWLDVIWNRTPFCLCSLLIGDQLAGGLRLQHPISPQRTPGTSTACCVKNRRSYIYGHSVARVLTSKPGGIWELQGGIGSFCAIEDGRKDCRDSREVVHVGDY